MFDIGLFELIAIGGVSLVVIGPERLPSAIRTCALWFGRFKHTVLEARKEIEQQLGTDEIKQLLRNERVMAELQKLEDARHEIEQNINEVVSSAGIEALPDHSDDGSHGEIIEHDDDQEHESYESDDAYHSHESDESHSDIIEHDDVETAVPEPPQDKNTESSKHESQESRVK